MFVAIMITLYLGVGVALAWLRARVSPNSHLLWRQLLFLVFLWPLVPVVFVWLVLKWMAAGSH